MMGAMHGLGVWKGLGSLALGAAALVLAGCGGAQDIASSGPGTSGSPVTPPPVSLSPTQPTDSPTTPITPSVSVTFPTTTSPGSDVAPRPEVGNCYDTRRKAFSSQHDGSTPIGCAKRHTAETFAVFQVGTAPSATEINEVWRVCQQRFTAYAGGSPTISTLGLTVMLPGRAQVEAGQGWIRCDAIQQPSYNGDTGLPRSGSVKGVLARGVPGTLRGCALHWPKVDQPVHFTSCKRRHQAELIPESLNLGGPEAAFPGVATTKSRSKAFCERTFQKYVSETLNFFYYYPTAASWRSGSHDTACWALDTHGDGLPPL